MGSGWSPNGVGSVQAYQPPAVPWVTGSLTVTGIRKVEFPNVSKFFTVRNRTASQLRVAFTEGGFDSNHAFTVLNNGTYTFNLRIRDVFLSGSGNTVDVLGGMTAIPRRFYQPLTGANPPPSGSWYVPGIE